MNDKESHEWTLDELVDFCAWRAVERLLKGTSLRSVIYEACAQAASWRYEKTKAEASQS